MGLSASVEVAVKVSYEVGVPLLVFAHPLSLYPVRVGLGKLEVFTFGEVVSDEATSSFGHQYVV